MSYQVLARKWRPKSFTELVGQTHVVQALSNGLSQNRLHHAFLFTGTRGVGKTTIARILAKSLNCETGVTTTPCEKCTSCIEVNQGRFLDLIEVDAASKTKVEDTRELLDNVQYAPTKGRYKVYLIDEVHMLSASSFNALLKTLEEPPEHVKFLLATTDPQKLPVTVLSRCLQFNLKRLTPEQISTQLNHILTQEGIGFDEMALHEIAIAADGSMRDSLSLLDQAIAYGNGEVREVEVRAMIGTLDRDRISQLLNCLFNFDAPALMQEITKLDEFSPNYDEALRLMLEYLQRIAIVQQAPEANAALQNASEIQDFASRVSAENVQLFYQICLTGRKDLPYAATPRSGFEMTLLRAIAFRPADAVVTATPVQSSTQQTRSANSEAPKASPTQATPAAKPKMPESVKAAVEAAPAPAPAPAPEASPAPAAELSEVAAPVAEPEVKAVEKPVAQAIVQQNTGDMSWKDIVPKLNLKGFAGQLADNTSVKSRTDNVWVLNLDESRDHIKTGMSVKALEEALTQISGSPQKVEINLVDNVDDSPEQIKQEVIKQNQANAEESIQNDPNVQALCAAFDGEVQPGSIRPIS